MGNHDSLSKNCKPTGMCIMVTVHMSACDTMYILWFSEAKRPNCFKVGVLFILSNKVTFTHFKNVGIVAGTHI